MNAKANKTLIGAFIIGALALAVAGIILFSSVGYFSQRPEYVMYFEGSVKGLYEGAPVVFRGVRIGSVKNISLHFDPDDASVRIPVQVQLDPQTITGAQSRQAQEQYFKQLIDKGLKAQLQLQNVLTGQLVIALDFYPDKSAQLVDKDSKYPEIPTVPSSLEQFTRTIENLPLEELANKLIAAVEGIEEAAKSKELRESIASLNLALMDMRTLIRDIDSQVGPVSSELKSTLADARTLLGNVDKRIAEMQAGVDRTAKAAQSAMFRAENVFGSIESGTTGESSVIYQLSETLEEISAAAESIRHLADYLERHPEALIRGRGSP
ncbi:MAG TPA: MlaD family protein [Deltaproteobacteria bacterium]|jgi:paraquat-inducible protein B|nr:MlaD family protein [Deltaproteobacteria bacterium]HRR21673.1 MlaD family protein [Desulfomonilia bacterium]HOE71873.1 MlaD family protein [Deltaproteobacteria bacterium]HON62131.1 MlaD family protein [Deltaproteobacteria bacterium]HOS26872.1 MlaD family protein [Deltaproteobacteria bacterium]